MQSYKENNKCFLLSRVKFSYSLLLTAVLLLSHFLSGSNYSLRDHCSKHHSRLFKDSLIPFCLYSGVFSFQYWFLHLIFLLPLSCWDPTENGDFFPSGSFVQCINLGSKAPLDLRCLYWRTTLSQQEPLRQNIESIVCIVKRLSSQNESCQPIQNQNVGLFFPRIKCTLT